MFEEYCVYFQGTMFKNAGRREEREKERQTDRHTDTQMDRKTDRDTQRDRDRDQDKEILRDEGVVQRGRNGEGRVRSRGKERSRWSRKYHVCARARGRRHFLT